jgi:hypothetical protein
VSNTRRAGRQVCRLREAAGRLGVDISHRSVFVMWLTTNGYHKRILKWIY